MLTWKASQDDSGQVRYNVYASKDYPVDITKAKNLIAVNLDTCVYIYNGRYAELNGLNFAITAIDRSGKESDAAQLHAFETVYIDGRLLPHANNQLLLPLMSPQPEFIILTDSEGRIVRTMPYARNITTQGLAGGYYQVRTLEKKGKSLRIGNFIK